MITALRFVLNGAMGISACDASGQSKADVEGGRGRVLTETIINIIESFEGVIGAVLGVVATLVTTNFLNNKGTVKSYFYDVSKRFSRKPNDWGIEDEVADWQNSEDCMIRFELLLHNTSSNIQPLKDISILAGDTKSRNEIFWRQGSVSDPDYSPTFDAINMKPGEIRKFMLNVKFTEEELFKDIYDGNVFLVYTLPNKTFRNKKKVKIKD